MNRFSEIARHQLENAGWKENRQITTDGIQQNLTDAGYKWFDEAEKFLREFAGIRVEFKTERGTTDSFHFDAIMANEGFDIAWVRLNYRGRVGKDLCVIGQGFCDHMTLLMDDSGRVFGGYDETLVLIGRSGDNAIERICNNERLGELPE